MVTSTLTSFLLFLSIPGFIIAAPVHQPFSKKISTKQDIVTNSLTSSPLVFPPDRQHCTGGSAHDSLSLLSSVPIACDKHTPPNTNGLTRWSCRMTEGFTASFLRIGHTRIHCENTSAPTPDNSTCNLDYHLDFSLLSIFLIGFAATTLCGTCLAVTMYVAVARMMASYNELNTPSNNQYICKGMNFRRTEQEIQPLCQVGPAGSSEPIPIPTPSDAADGFDSAKPLGYGSFGKKFEVHELSGSFSSLLEMSPMPSPPPSPPSSPSSPLPRENGDSGECDEEDASHRLRTEHIERMAMLETELYMS